eukprot:6187376-Pleurochrysis_carterae.AAC.5
MHLKAHVSNSPWTRVHCSILSCTRLQSNARAHTHDFTPASCEPSHARTHVNPQMIAVTRLCKASPVRPAKLCIVSVSSRVRTLRHACSHAAHACARTLVREHSRALLRIDEH